MSKKLQIPLEDIQEATNKLLTEFKLAEMTLNLGELHYCFRELKDLVDSSDLPDNVLQPYKSMVDGVGITFTQISQNLHQLKRAIQDE